MFRIDMLPAGRGDGLWIEYGDPDRPRRVLIDGGVGRTYDVLRTRLEALPESDRRFELVLVSHLDLDHIAGVLELLRNPPAGLVIGDLWFNGWHHLPPDLASDAGLLGGDGGDQELGALLAGLPAAAVPGDPELSAWEGAATPASHDEGLLGPKQAEGLEARIHQRGIPWNRAFGGQAVQVEEAEGEARDFPVRELAGGLKLTVLTPTADRLRRLRRAWKKEIDKAGLEPGRAGVILEGLDERREADTGLLGPDRLDVERLAENKRKQDRSVGNGSSLAVLLEHDGRRALLTGDALPEDLTVAVRALARREGEARLAVDALKLSHHGGEKNTSRDLIETLACRRVLISTDGSYYHHPDRESIARVLVGARTGGGGVGGRDLELCFNYRSEPNEVWRDRDLERRWRYRAVYPEPGDEGSSVSL